VGPREHVLDVGAHWRNLANTTEPSMCGGDAAFLSNYFDHLLCLREPEKWDVSERLTDIGRVRYNAAVRCSLMHWKMATNGMLGGMIPIAPLNLSVSHRKWYG